jgi:lipopolysaccharide biosynthesis glycosyltransferase
LGDYYLAAVTNPFGPKSRAPRWPIDIGLPNMGSYFNSGVMLMNLAQMRRDMTIERIVVHGATPIERLPYPDQDALNLALRGRWLHLHPRWNMQNAILESEDYNNVFDPVALRESRITPALIHFEGPAFLKPWDVRCPHPFASLYRKHRRQTPWPYYIPDGMLQKCLLSLTPAMIRSRLRALKAH